MRRLNIFIVTIACLLVSGFNSLLAAKYSDSPVEILIQQSLGGTESYPFGKAEIEMVEAANGGKEEDLLCQSKSNAGGKISCFIDLEQCDDNIPFEVSYDVSFKDVPNYRAEPDTVKIILNKCKWLEPKDLKTTVTYRYNQPEVVEKYEAITASFISNYVKDEIAEDKLPESYQLEAAFKSASGLKIYDSDYVDFVKASRELSAIYSNMLFALPKDNMGGERELLKYRATQYSAFTTLYANQSLKKFENYFKPESGHGIHITGLLADYERNVFLIKESLSDISQGIDGQSGLTNEEKNRIKITIEELANHERLEAGAFANIDTINREYAYK